MMAEDPRCGSTGSDTEGGPEPKRQRISSKNSVTNGKGCRQAANKCHLLAFGDSLTLGGFGSRSYPAQLQEQLNGEEGSCTRYEVHNAGLCGEGTEDMVNRIGEELGLLARRGIQPSFVLVLGGTNDLGHLTPHQILANLAEIRAIITKTKARCVALTIPRDEQGLGPVARAVNEGLRSEATKEGGPLLADVSTVPEANLSDGLHFDSEGYAEFARISREAMSPEL